MDVSMNIPRPHEAKLQLWTIYSRRLPDCCLNYIARQSVIGGEIPQHLMVSTDLDALRRQMQQLGLRHRERHPDDQLDIVELWL